MPVWQSVCSEVRKKWKPPSSNLGLLLLSSHFWPCTSRPHLLATTTTTNIHKADTKNGCNGMYFITTLIQNCTTVTKNFVFYCVGDVDQQDGVTGVSHTQTNSTNR